MNSRIRKLLPNFLLTALGGAIMALGIALFFEPKNIVPGGLTGVAMMLNSLFPVLPVGMTVMVLNVPLFIVGWRRLGGMFVAYSLTGTASLSLFIDVFARLPVPECQPLAAVMLGGALVGAGIGLVFSRGGSTGGSDLMARLLKAVFPSARMGALMLSVDGAVVFASMFVFGGGELYAALDLAFYAIAGLFVSSQLADLILYGTNVQWTAHIISDDWTAVSAALQNELGRGVTLLKGEGGYSGAAREVILCAVGRSQLATMKAVVKETDPHAFIIVNKAYEVLGEGFRAYDKNSI